MDIFRVISEGALCACNNKQGADLNHKGVHVHVYICTVPNLRAARFYFDKFVGSEKFLRVLSHNYSGTSAPMTWEQNVQEFHAVCKNHVR